MAEMRRNQVFRDVSSEAQEGGLRAFLEAGERPEIVAQENCVARFQRYRAHMALMGELVAYLTAECCGGHPEACLGPHAVAACTDCP